MVKIWGVFPLSRDTESGALCDHEVKSLMIAGKEGNALAKASEFLGRDVAPEEIEYVGEVNIPGNFDFVKTSKILDVVMSD